MDSTSVSSTQDSMQSDSSEIPVQNDIWFAKDTMRFEDYLGDVSEEAERVRSGYYLDIQESLDTCLRYYDYMENPFYKLHVGAVQYLQYWKNQTRKQSIYTESDSSSQNSTSVIDTSPDTLIQFDSPEMLNKAIGESIMKKRNVGKHLDNDMSGIGLLSSSSNATSQISGLEDSLPEHMDNVLNELSSMEPEELSRLINNPSPPANDNIANNCTNKLLCYETMHSSSPDVESADSTASTTVSQQEISAAAALCYLNKRKYTREAGTLDTSDSSSSDVPEDIYEYKKPLSPKRLQFRYHNCQKNTC